jgi:hypothetical protein
MTPGIRIVPISVSPGGVPQRLVPSSLPGVR